MAELYLSFRDRQILSCLLEPDKQTWSVQDLADKLNVSTRTIHRDLSHLPTLLNRYQLELKKQAGTGLSITGDTAAIQKLKDVLNTSITERSPEERRAYLIAKLLTQEEPQKISSLARECLVSPVTINQDLNYVDDWLQAFDLHVSKRRSWGIIVEGKEEAKRRAMSVFVREQLSEEELFHLFFPRQNFDVKGNVSNNSILQLINQEWTVAIADALSAALQKYPYQLADQAYIQLIVHLCLLVERVKAERILNWNHQRETYQGTKEYEVATEFSLRLEEKYQIQIPESEKLYICSLLQGSKVSSVPQEEGHFLQNELHFKAYLLIEEVSSHFFIKTDIRQELASGLIIHLERAIYRLQHKMNIDNPLLAELKNRYRLLFAITKESVEKIFPEYQMPEEEIGYLVMHFGALLESSQMAQPIRVLLVCSSGIGTSKLLMSRLQKEFPTMTEIESRSLQELANHQADYDLLISTISLHEVRGEYIKVSPFLHENDIKRISAYLEKLEPKSPLERVKKTRGNLLLPFIKEWSTTVFQLIEEFTFVALTSSESLDEVLGQISQTLARNQHIRNQLEVIHQLKQRQELGGLGIPETSLALFHMRSADVLRPSLSMFTLSNPLSLEGMDGNQMEVYRLLVLIAPNQLTTAELEGISWISSLLVENEENMDIFNRGREEAIVDLLQVQADFFLYEKMKG